MTQHPLTSLVRLNQDFQTSVNIAYDLRDVSRIRAFIPTTSAMDIFDTVLRSLSPKSNQRAQLLVGAYGRGKSHIILMLLALLSAKKRIPLFSSLLAKMRSYDSALAQLAEEWLGNKRLLPVVVRGSYASVSQAFLNALQTTLAEEEFEDILPDTHFKEAIKTIDNWRKQYPDAFERFKKVIGYPIKAFITDLDQNDPQAYARFFELYPELTNGSKFNPFIGADVPELYEMVAEKVKTKGYSGLFVVYDEFSKYLEKSISEATVSDTKMLQDFAEKCNRSGSASAHLHLLLISHKDIANYIDKKLPKEKVDGWQGVSGRFQHIALRNNYSQLYEIISEVITKKQEAWDIFTNKNYTRFNDLENQVVDFGLLSRDEAEVATRGCYPLHPVSTFILPRLSERIAQNERTLFTFLAADEPSSLSAFIQKTVERFPLLTPDALYDYFEPLLKKDSFESDAHRLWKLASKALAKMNPLSLEAKIVKTLALIYLIEQFEKLPPTKRALCCAFSECGYDEKKISATLHHLEEKEHVVYLRRSDGYWKLKEHSGVDIRAEIYAFIDKNHITLSIKDILNQSTFDNCLYPVRYNDEHDITRWFDFVFMDGIEFLSITNWDTRLAKTRADGIVCAIIPENNQEVTAIRKVLVKMNHALSRVLFILPRKYRDIASIIMEYEAVKHLRTQVVDDPVLAEEYDLYWDDLSEMVSAFVAGYTNPGSGNVSYWHSGKELPFVRKSQLSEALSHICDEAYPDAPIINNESINKHHLSGMAFNSRAKLLAGLLAPSLLPNLGLTGTGQDVSMMRSVLIQTGLLQNVDTVPEIVAKPSDKKIRNLMEILRDFFAKASKRDGAKFSDLYRKLLSPVPEGGIGLKLGIIPVFIAIAVRDFKHNLVFLNNGAEVKLTAELLARINENPEPYSVMLEDWDDVKAAYLARLEKLFAPCKVEQEKTCNDFASVVSAMVRWYLALPKYAKEQTGNDQGAVRFVNALKQPDINPREFLFDKIPQFFNMKGFSLDVADNVVAAKAKYDGAIDALIVELADEVRTIFCHESVKKRLQSSAKSVGLPSLNSIIRDWCDGLKETTKQRLFDGMENRILELMQTVTPDETVFIQRLAKAVTGLRLEDWNDDTAKAFLVGLWAFKTMIEDFDSHKGNVSNKKDGNYKITFPNEDGHEITKIFPHTQTSPKAILLKNEILSMLIDYGQALTEQEKRQVLMEALETLC